MLESTAFLANSKTFVGGLNDNTGSFKGRSDMTDTNGQVALRTAMLAGTPVTLNLFTDAVHKFSGSALIKDMALKAAVAGLVEVTVNFQGTGDWIWS